MKGERDGKDEAGKREQDEGQRRYVRCEECGTPVAEWVDGELVILARHHGERHVTRVGNHQSPRASS